MAGGRIVRGRNFCLLERRRLNFIRSRVRKNWSGYTIVEMAGWLKRKWDAIVLGEKYWRGIDFFFFFFFSFFFAQVMNPNRGLRGLLKRLLFSLRSLLPGWKCIVPLDESCSCVPFELGLVRRWIERNEGGTIDICTSLQIRETRKTRKMNFGKSSRSNDRDKNARYSFTTINYTCLNGNFNQCPIERALTTWTWTKNLPIIGRTSELLFVRLTKFCATFSHNQTVLPRN